MSLFSNAGMNLTAIRLAALAQGFTTAADDDLISQAASILEDYSAEERQVIAAKAVALGADELVIQSLLNVSGGEVIEVVGKVPRGKSFPWWLLGLVGAAGAGVYAWRRRKQRKRK